WRWNVHQFHLHAAMRQFHHGVRHLHAAGAVQRQRLGEGVDDFHAATFMALRPSTMMQSPNSTASEVTPWSGNFRRRMLERIMLASAFSMTRLIHCGLRTSALVETRSMATPPCSRKKLSCQK